MLTRACKDTSMELQTAVLAVVLSRRNDTHTHTRDLSHWLNLTALRCPSVPVNLATPKHPHGQSEQISPLARYTCTHAYVQF